MNRLEQFEYPLPHLQLHTDRISMETADGGEGVLLLENSGGGELMGTITSNSRAIAFHPTHFHGNRTEITYTFDLGMYRQGDVLRTSALITSNGGEAVIPIEIRVVPPIIAAKDGAKLSTLSDFSVYAQANPAAARQLFTQPDFWEWLLRMGYAHMDLYELFTHDPNKERAIDHFLVLNQLKEKAVVRVAEPQLTITISPEGTDETGVITLRRSSWGYADVSLTEPADIQWLKLSKTRLTSADFNSEQIAEVFFIVAASEAAKRRQTAHITVSSEGTTADVVHITAVRPTGLSADTDKEVYYHDDTGLLLLRNSTGHDLMVEITPSDPLVRFEGKKYFISEHAEIPFWVKRTGLLSVQAAMQKQLTIEAEIQVRAKIGATYIHKRLPVRLTQLAK